MRFWDRRVLLATLLAGVLASGCLAPSLPLPPPALPVATASSDGDPNKVHLAGNGVEAHAFILVYNQAEPDPGKRVGGAEADGVGQWQTNVFAHKGDRLTIQQILAGKTSASTDFVVP